MDGELRIEEGRDIFALDNLHRARLGFEIHRVYHKKTFAFFDEGEEVKADGAAVDEAHVIGESIPITQCIYCVDSDPLVAKQQVAYAKDRYLDYSNSFDGKNL